MTIALAQINPKVGDVQGNLAKICRFIKTAKKKGALLIIFPEMALLGYPPRDLLDRPTLIAQALNALDVLIPLSDTIDIIIGNIAKNKSGKSLCNAGYWLAQKKIKTVFYKNLLPTYDVFDEARHFEPGKQLTIVPFKNKKVALSICEDMWGQTFDHYDRDPFAQLHNQKIDWIINLSASPFEKDKTKKRLDRLQSLAKNHQATCIYVNQVGANDELLFDGNSMVVNADEKLLLSGPIADEKLLYLDLEKNLEKPTPSQNKTNASESLLKVLTMGIKDYVHKTGFQKVILGLSGGIDSALVATLAVKALGAKNVTALFMPSRYTSKESGRDSRELAKNLGITLKEISIDPIHSQFLKEFKKVFYIKNIKNKKEDATEENIQARIRANWLMAFANKEQSLLLTTGNKSEIAVGYCTLYGDMCGALNPIGDLYKTEVYQLAEWINRKKQIIPKNILTRAPSAELRLNQTDQDSLPDYAELDFILKKLVEENKSVEEIIELGTSKTVVEKVNRLLQLSEHKRRQAAPILRVSSKAFGMGRRYPIATSYRS